MTQQWMCVWLIGQFKLVRSFVSASTTPTTVIRPFVSQPKTVGFIAFLKPVHYGSFLQQPYRSIRFVIYAVNERVTVRIHLAVCVRFFTWGHLPQFDVRGYFIPSLAVAALNIVNEVSINVKLLTADAVVISTHVRTLPLDESIGSRCVSNGPVAHFFSSPAAVSANRFISPGSMISVAKSLSPLAQ